MPLREQILRRPKYELVLAGLLAVGVVLRLWITLTWKPAFVGYYDAGSYARAAREGVFIDMFRPAGYPAFMRVLHAFSDSVLTVTAFQHLLGIATALILYVAVRKVTRSPWVALIPAAVILLNGFQVLIEHAVLSDTLFMFLIALALLTVVQAPQHRVLYALAPGLLIAAAATVRNDRPLPGADLPARLGVAAPARRPAPRRAGGGRRGGRGLRLPAVATACGRREGLLARARLEHVLARRAVRGLLEVHAARGHRGDVREPPAARASGR